MKRKFRSISWKIWFIMVRTTVLLLILFFLLSTTLLRKTKNEFIFEQLKQSAETNRATDHTSKVIGDLEQSLSIAHFRIEKHDDYFSLSADSFTKHLYFNKEENREIIDRIIKLLSAETIKENKGILKSKGLLYYFYVDWDENKNSAMIYLASTSKNNELTKEIMINILGILIVSFFASRTVARKFSKPIEELKVFAEEISRRNWNATVPITDSDEVGLLAESLEKMRDSLKVAEERDRQFLQSTSHDLKTPVMIIKGYAQAMIDGITVNSEEPMAEVIKAESERLERKITQLLRLNTLGHSLEYRENREVIRIDRLLKSLVSKFQVVRPELTWELALEELEINGDSEALLIAFENIIENQLRYATSLVRIGITSHEKLEIFISNDGPPFELSNLSELFDPYKKDKAGKFGLGLAIAKQVIIAHEGTISAHNLNQGIEFRITFQ